jgi:hypothetical protein
MEQDSLTLLRWHYAMCQAGQRPCVFRYASFGPDARNHKPLSYRVQLGHFGRPYDHDRDKELWHWMRLHEAPVIAFLQRLGSYRDGSGHRILANESRTGRA